MTQPPGGLRPLFFAFLRLGLTAFGGPSMVAYIRRVVVEHKHWLAPKDFNEGVAFCQMVPGATAMQTAAWVGLRLGGVAGAAACFIGFGLPAFCLMLGSAALYQQTGSLPAVAAVFSGLQSVVVAIIANAAYTYGRVTLKSWRHLLITALAAGLFWLNANSLLVILTAAALGWLLFAAPEKMVGPGSIAPPSSPATLPPLVTSSPQVEPAGPTSGCEQAARGPVAAIRFSPVPLAVLLLAGGAGLAALAWLAPDLLRLALLMIKVDLMAFGGGYASVPIMYHEVVEVSRWMPGPTFMNGIILGQVTPGPIVITATFIGYLLGGLGGALVATLAIFGPSFLIVIGLAPFFNRLTGSPVFRRIILGVLCSFVGLLVSTTLRFALQVQWDLVHICLASAAGFALLRKVDLSWVVVGGVIGSLALVRYL